MAYTVDKLPTGMDYYAAARYDAALRIVVSMSVFCKVQFCK